MTNAECIALKELCGVCGEEPRLAGENWGKKCLDKYMKALPKKRGNPNWARGYMVIENKSTAFERYVAEIGIPESQFSTSTRVRQWVKRWHNSRYVPEWLLDEFGLKVTETNFSDHSTRRN